MIFQGFLILLLHADGLTQTPKRRLEIPLEEANCYTHRNHDICYNLKEVTEVDTHLVDLVNSDLDLNDDLIHFNHISNTLRNELRFFYNFVKNKLNIVDKDNNYSLKLLLRNSQNTVLNTSRIILNNYSENVWQQSTEDPLTIFGGSGDVKKHKTCNSIFACNKVNNGGISPKVSKMLNKQGLKDGKAILSDQKQVILKITKLTSSKENGSESRRGLNSKVQNTADKNILAQQHIFTNIEKKTRNGHYIGDLEIFFRISIFLMLFIIVFMFNIYYCGSIMYCVYKKRFVPLDR